MNKISVLDFNLLAVNCGYFDGYSIDRNTKLNRRKVYDYEVEYYIESDGGIEIDGNNIMFEKETVNFRKPGQIVKGIMPYKCYIVCIDILGNKDKLYSDYKFGNPTYAQPRYDNKILNSIPDKLPAGKCINIGKIIKRIYENYIQNNEVQQLEIKSDLYQLISELYSASINQNTTLLNYNSAIKKSIKYIQENLNEIQNIEQISKHIGLSTNYFQKIFKDSLGVTPNNFIINLKLEKAKYLLSVTDLNIAEVACQCGFLDNVYFSYVFKKKEGITPREYRDKFIDLQSVND